MTLRTGPFRKEDRVRKRPEYQSITRRCTPMFTACLVFYACSSPEGGRRLGCTVPRSVGNAVVRNRVKRLVREAFRASRERFPEACALVVNAKRSAGALTHAGVLKAFGDVAERIAREGIPPCAP